MQRSLEFEVPAMRLAVKSKGRVKRDASGATVFTERIVPKGRPRLGRTKNVNGQPGKSVTYTPDSTSKFEKHIRDSFFKAYEPKHGVIAGNKTVGVHNEFMGCAQYGEGFACLEYRKCRDFSACKGCRSRRKNLEVKVVAFLKDDRHIDGDNILKIVLDAMEKVVFYDDTQFYKKSIKIIPHAETERISIEVQVVEEHMSLGSLVCAYDFKLLSVANANEYARRFTHLQEFLEYLRRRDKRKYIEELSHGSM